MPSRLSTNLAGAASGLDAGRLHDTGAGGHDTAHTAKTAGSALAQAGVGAAVTHKCCDAAREGAGGCRGAGGQALQAGLRQGTGQEQGVGGPSAKHLESCQVK